MSLYVRFTSAFAILIVICIGLLYYSNKISQKSSQNDFQNISVLKSPEFNQFQRNYLIVYSLSMFADWIQGPYIYELYVSYGYSEEHIASLFVAGFASSLLFGTFIGGIGDIFGRKKMCLLYNVFYIISCITKIFNNYYSLLLGRILSGVATSLLFSSFDSYMICEHNKKNFSSLLLSDTYSWATFYNGIIAVLAGLIANYSIQFYSFLTPFLIAILPLILNFILISYSFNENYGNENQILDNNDKKNNKNNMFDLFYEGFSLIFSNVKILYLGLSQSFYEGAMYTFVFMWTPSLKEEEKGIDGNESDNVSNYLGLIFSSYMICVMIGSTIFKIYIHYYKNNLKNLVLFNNFFSFVIFLIITLYIDDENSKVIIFICFLLYELTVGIFYPSFGTIKSIKISENIRSIVLNIFRIPLNLFIIIILLKIKHLNKKIIFFICFLLLFLSYLFIQLYYFYDKQDNEKRDLDSINSSSIASTSTSSSSSSSSSLLEEESDVLTSFISTSSSTKVHNRRESSSGEEYEKKKLYEMTHLVSDTDRR